jgi:dATP pyrophosphohydrolase
MSRIPHEIMVFVRRGAEFLVLHRAPELDAYWHVVAGALEGEETPREAALRELREELALDAEAIVDLDHRFTYPLAEQTEAVRARFDASVSDIRVDCFVVEVTPGWEPTLNEEHDGYRWLTAGAAAELLFWPEPRALVLELT